MNKITFSALEAALNETNFDHLFQDVAGCCAEDFEDDTRFGLSFNVETDELCLIKYITNEDNSWVSVYENQNPCIIVGYVGANDVIAGNPASDIVESYKYNYPELAE